VPNVMKCGSLNLLEPSGPYQACYGTALPLLFTVLKLNVHFVAVLCYYFNPVTWHEKFHFKGTSPIIMDFRSERLCVYISDRIVLCFKLCGTIKEKLNLN